MSKIPLAKRKKFLAKKKVKRQLLENPKIHLGGQMTRGKNHVEDHSLDASQPYFIQK